MDNFYYPSLCHTCKTPNKNIKRCSNCKLLSYCCKQHQHLDWTHHKKVCNVLKEHFLSWEIPPCSYTEFTAKRLQLKLSLETSLNRQLHRYEAQLCFFPRVCNICYTTTNLKYCETCLNVAHCSAEHEKRDQLHQAHCNSLKLSMLCDIYNFKHGIFIPNIHIPKIPPKITNLHDFLESLTRNDEETIKTLNWDCLAPGATILQALERSGIVQNRQHVHDSLTIHLVGANDFETYSNWELITEFFFHWITNLNRIHIILIGPELHANIPHISTNFCSDCKSKRTTLEMHSKHYESIVNELRRADIVVAFNSGLHEFENSDQDTWRASLASFKGAPLLLTAYTLEEIRRDLNRFENFQILQQEERNPFANRRPLRDWSSESRPIFYVNGFYTIIMC